MTTNRTAANADPSAFTAPAPIRLSWETTEGGRQTATHRGATFTIEPSAALGAPRVMSMQLRPSGAVMTVDRHLVTSLIEIACAEAGYVERDHQREAERTAVRERITRENARMTRSLLRTLKGHGFTAYRMRRGDNGKTEMVTNEAELIEHLTAFDDVRLRVQRDGTIGASTLLLVYGNSAEELVADWSVPADAATAEALQAAIDDYSAKNEGR